MSRAVCVRCGGDRVDYSQVCPACGHRPAGDGLLVAWLLSDANLGRAALDAAAARIRAGEPIRPTPNMLAKARRALGQDLSSDPGLSVGQRALIASCSLVLTPLVGWTCWWWWREDRPRAALQALAMSLPFTVLFTAIWFWRLTA